MRREEQFGTMLSAPRRLGGRDLLLAAFLIIGMGAFILAPWSLEEKIWAIAYGICPQRASHSFFLGGAQLPLEARMTGIFGGFLITIGYLFLLGRARASRLPQARILIALVGFIALVGLDGGNASLYDFGLPYVYPPQNWLRLATGLLSGVAMAVVTWAVFSFTFWREPSARAVIKDWREVIGLLAVPALAFVAILGRLDFLFYLIALTSVLGVLALLTLLNTVFLLAASGKQGKGESWWDLLPAASGGLFLSLVELGLLSALKFLVLGPNPLS